MTTMTDQSILSTPSQLLEKILSSEEVFKEDITTTLVFADKELRTLREQNKRLREALEFYANIHNWDDVETKTSAIRMDDCQWNYGFYSGMTGGKRARKALKECGE